MKARSAGYLLQGGRKGGVLRGIEMLMISQKAISGKYAIGAIPKVRFMLYLKCNLENKFS
jgi:hypothetical protein